MRDLRSMFGPTLCVWLPRNSRLESAAYPIPIYPHWQALTDDWREDDTRRRLRMSRATRRYFAG